MSVFIIICVSDTLFLSSLSLLSLCVCERISYKNCHIGSVKRCHYQQQYNQIEWDQLSGLRKRWFRLYYVTTLLILAKFFPFQAAFCDCMRVFVCACISHLRLSPGELISVSFSLLLSPSSLSLSFCRQKRSIKPLCVFT